MEKLDELLPSRLMSFDFDFLFPPNGHLEPPPLQPAFTPQRMAQRREQPMGIRRMDAWTYSPMDALPYYVEKQEDN